MNHTWPFFNALYPSAEGGSGAHHVHLTSGQGTEDQTRSSSPFTNVSPFASQSNLNLPSARERKLSLQVNHTSKSFEKGDTKNSASVAAKGYRSFYPGDYLYNFELPIDSKLPETIDVDLGSVKYELEATIERAGAFRGNMTGAKTVTLIRAPGEGSLEQVEPIAISRNWEDQLHYDIVISGKSFPLGAKIPIAFKLTPLAKVQCHRVKVFITENTEYFCSNKRVHRMEPTRKVLLYEKRADGTTTSTFPGSSARVIAGGGVPFDQREAAARGDPFSPQDTTNLLGRLDHDTNVGPTEMEFNVQLPGCHQFSDKERQNKLHFDTTYSNIQVHHWIKVCCLRILLVWCRLTLHRLYFDYRNQTQRTRKSVAISKSPSTRHFTYSPVVQAHRTRNSRHTPHLNRIQQIIFQIADVQVHHDVASHLNTYLLLPR
jgi:hypothetical protein